MDLSSYRRIVPEGYVESTLKLVGTSPLLMNSAEVDLDSDLYRARYALGQKARKTQEDEAQLRRMEWEMALYLDPKIGPYVPSTNLKELLRSAATKWRRGEDVKRSLVIVESRVPLIYDGPRDEKSLWDDGFRYTTRVANSGASAGRVMRCRPMFAEWAIETRLAYDPEELDHDILELIVERSQKYGLGDYRPEFGSFKALLDGVEVRRKARATGLSVKERNGHEERGHDALAGRVLVSTT